MASKGTKTDAAAMKPGAAPPPRAGPTAAKDGKVGEVRLVKSMPQPKPGKTRAPKPGAKEQRSAAAARAVDAASRPADVQSRAEPKQMTLAPAAAQAATAAANASRPERVPLHKALAGFKQATPPGPGAGGAPGSAGPASMSLPGSPGASGASASPGEPAGPAARGGPGGSPNVGAGPALLPDVPRARIAVARPATLIRIRSEHPPEFEPSPTNPRPAAPPQLDFEPDAEIPAGTTTEAPAFPPEAAEGGQTWKAPAPAKVVPPPSPRRALAPAPSPRGSKSKEPARPRLVGRAPRPGAPEVATPDTPLRCKSWRTEAILRMLENNLHNAEEPDKLIVYGGTGKAARNPEALAAIKATLTSLADDETLLVQSGKPVAVFKTWPQAPRVLIANSHLVPRWSTWEAFNELEQMGLTMYGQMTAGSWCYIGTQGIIQGTYETFAQAARTHFGQTATLRHRIVLTAGLGGMGGAQPRAVTMSGGVCLAIEVDPARAQRRKESGFLDIIAPDLKTGRQLAERAAQAGEPLAIAVIGNAADDFPALLAANFQPHLVTDQTSAHDPLSYVPSGHTVAQSQALRETDPEQHRANAYQSMARHVQAMVGFLNEGAHVFDYGNNIREGAVSGGLPRDAAYSFPGFVPAYIRPMFCEGRGPFRWISLKGDLRDIERTEDLLLSMFPTNKVLTNWIQLARATLPVEGLPARVCWLGMGERDQFALAINELVAAGKIGPIAVTRDHLDSGSVASPFRETESMLDGSDAIADWPILNAMVNIAAGADSVHLHNGGGVGIGYSTHAGMVVVLDGSPLASEKARRVFRSDPGMGIVRHADAGYAKALEVAKATGVRTPLV